MWRTASLFGHDSIPTHHAAIHNPTAPHTGDHDGHGLWGDTTHLCHICHAELQTHEFAAGCCDDKDACCWRALSERCCW